MWAGQLRCDVIKLGRLHSSPHLLAWRTSLQLKMTLIVRLFVALATFMCAWVSTVDAGVPIPGLESGPTPFQTIFATGFGGSYNTFGTGTTAGAIGAYGRFVSGGANSDTHGVGRYGHGK